MVQVFSRKDWAKGDGWNGGWEGEAGDTQVSFIFNDVTEPGLGPRLHSHDYDEVQIVRHGKALYTFDGKEYEASEGDIVVIPAGTHHKVRTVGPRSDVISVHLTDRKKATWLE